MSQGAPHPRMHGYTHVPGGADPIPDVGTFTAFPTLIGELATTRDLRGYWRLGEGASPFADTSGHPGGAANAVRHTSTTAMTLSVTGALPTADDDGAVEFNALGTGDWLQTAVDNARFDFDSGDVEVTVAAWVKPAASGTAEAATVCGSYLNHGTFGPSGYRLGINYPALTPFFQRRLANGAHTQALLTGTAMAAGSWYFLAGTYDLTNGHGLYVNGSLVATDAATLDPLPTFAQGFWIAYGQNSATAHNLLAAVDEVSVWGDALTAAEIAKLATAGDKLGAGAAVQVYTGTGTPDPLLGSTADLYFDTASGNVYHQTSGGWVLIGALT